MRRLRSQATRARKIQNPLLEGLKAPHPRNFPSALLLTPLALVLLAVLGGFFMGGESTVTQPQSQAQKVRTAPLPLRLDSDEQAGATESPALPGPEPLSITVRRGDSMSHIFERAGIGPGLLHQLAYESAHGKHFRKILPGKTFLFHFDENNSVTRIIYEVSPLEYYEAIAGARGFTTSHHLRTPDIYTTLRHGEIHSSFYLDGLRAGLNDNQIMELASIFGWDIDFALEIRAGDQFSVLYEEKFLGGEYLGTGRILAAEFINRGKSIRALRYEDQSGKASYYTPEGLSMRKVFLRTPLDVFRISSHFNLKRKHPILNTIRAHKGTDYAAPRGTPIKAAGDGKVVFAGRNGGYGNMVKISHGQTYETRYGHLRGFATGIRAGKRVRQGQIIGYVGSTGLATGPHLHYEFYVNGSVRNPVTVKLPNGKPISASELPLFKASTAPMLTMLDVRSSNYVALDDTRDANDS